MEEEVEPGTRVVCHGLETVWAWHCKFHGVLFPTSDQHRACLEHTCELSLAQKAAHVEHSLHWQVAVDLASHVEAHSRFLGNLASFALVLVLYLMILLHFQICF